jgi:hypothetical protein
MVAVGVGVACSVTARGNSLNDVMYADLAIHDSLWARGNSPNDEAYNVMYADLASHDSLWARVMHLMPTSFCIDFLNLLVRLGVVHLVDSIVLELGVVGGVAACDSSPALLADLVRW